MQLHLLLLQVTFGAQLMRINANSLYQMIYYDQIILLANINISRNDRARRMLDDDSSAETHFQNYMFYSLNNFIKLY